MNTKQSSVVPHREHELVITEIRKWVQHAVIGLNLCPFAKAVHTKERIRYVVSDASDPERLCEDLCRELQMLHTSNPAQIETTLLVHPHVLNDFLDYNDFLDVADAIIEDMHLAGEIQIASFHPNYQFAGTSADAVENYTNRSPYPMLQLLRESSIEAAAASYPDASEIYERNIETLHALGMSGLRDLGVFKLAEQIEAANKPKK
ncbi:DUF1415 domain-containing protein [Oxalobacteraceae bacterium R-40]|uniref:DUF1415 domain-containing protein n=1 Tax=Keguizhuia sedimenti TaxID=3064264 RepID=A0ABU1BU20_9BURK|nr:DUF1415 domain-containing protein [Oxalobacteraceae bacterium R-40]